ncbi:methyltransferase [Glaciibacter sp. 2TAF33]|uniref:methyltransferase n=1 Tax=Glaciibacter sp. 2TAF33 TaxID=3233015 RepID=UPI003F8FFF89
MTSTTPRPNTGHPLHQPFSWVEDGRSHTAHWHSEGGWPAPTRLVSADDRTTADAAYWLVKNGTALLWRGDYRGARQLLSALGRRIDQRVGRGQRMPRADLATVFRRQRVESAERARLLGMLLVPLDPDYGIPLRRSPDARLACTETWGETTEPSVTSLRELVGVIGAHEWRTTGVEIPALEGRIHPHYGVFSPIRGEYLDLVATAPLGSAATAFDIGTGTGVLAAILAHRGIRHVVGTDQEPRALACARANIDRLGLAAQVDIVKADLFPVGRADLIVCNPPWIPAAAATSTDHAVYDPDSRMLLGFLDGLAEHLELGGEGWLVISDIAERLGLRSRGDLLDAIEGAGLAVEGRMDIRPVHGRAADATDPLHAARSAEVTSLWRLRAA